MIQEYGLGLVKAAVRCIATAGIAASLVQAAPAQDGGFDDRSTQEYSDLLDGLFPRDLSGTQYTFAVRLEPSFRAESQLLVRVLHDASVSAELSEVTGRNAWEALAEMRRPGRRALTMDEIAGTVAVSRRAVALDLETAHGWQTSLLAAVSASSRALETVAREDFRSKTATVHIVADGVAYRVWYSQGLATMHVDFLGLDAALAPSTPLLPLIRWAADVMEGAKAKARPER